MGVKDLWSILSPVCERKSLWELQGKTIAVDLSCWICDSQNISDNKSQPRMYLRNLFFRTNCLLLLGVRPIFVLEGQAPELKYHIMEKRKMMRNKGIVLSQPKVSNKGKRSRLNSLLHKCQQLLTIMGLSCVESPGEAEAFCALLNRSGRVDGCITQDGDCFLYGAETVYRNFTISPSGGSSGSNSGFSIDVYKMSVIENRLSLGRNDLIAISLLCGCDYNEKGVSGVGKETVLKFLSGVKDEDALTRLKRWRTDLYFDNLEETRTMVLNGILCEVCGHNGRKVKHTKNGCELCGELKGCKKNTNFIVSDPAVVAELNIRKRALLDPEFPSQMMIDEFLHEELLSDEFTLDKWKRPDLKSFIEFAVKLLGWSETYAAEKFLPLLTRWQLMELQEDNNTNSRLKFLLCPEHIVKKRVIRGVESYEIKWSNPDGGIFQVDPSIALITVEPQNLIDKAYPEMVESYTLAKRKKGKKVITRKQKNLNSCDMKKTTENEKENVHCTRKQTRIDRFFNSPLIVQKKKRDLKSQTNINNTLQCSNEVPSTLMEKQTESSAVKLISDYFSEMNLEHKAQGLQKSKSSIKLLKLNNSIYSPRCNHHKEKGVWENSNIFEKSLIWDVCEMCAEDDPINDEDLSVIIDSIVSKNNLNPATNELLEKDQVIRLDTATSDANETFDEFDNLPDTCVPLIDRLMSQL